MTWLLTWLFSMCGWCYEHRKREQWDNYRSYVCPDCAQTPEYLASLGELV